MLHARTSRVHTSETSQVCRVHLVSPMQPNKSDRPNRPNEQDRLADFFSILLELHSADFRVRTVTLGFLR